MRRASSILAETEQIMTVQALTAVFESIASTQVAKIKSKVVLSQAFFSLLWRYYSVVRSDPRMRITDRTISNNNGRSIYIIIAAEAGLGGDLDQRLVETMLQTYDKNTADIIVLGSHGAAQLAERGIDVIKFFRAPETDAYVDVSPIVRLITPYARIIVYYPEYISLGVQEIRTLDLLASVETMSQQAGDELIAAADTIFEPSLDFIADEMEHMMVGLAFSQSILGASLAQDASRFNAMAMAKKRAGELVADYNLEFHRAKRSESDRRLREVMVSLKKKKRTRR